MAVRIKESAERKLALLLEHESQELLGELRDIDDAALALVDINDRLGVQTGPDLLTVLDLSDRILPIASGLADRARLIRERT